MKNDITKEIQESISVQEKVLASLVDDIERAAQLIISAYKDGKKLLIFGNGGSAADSQHMAAELIGRYKKERKSFPALALSVDTSIITAIGNDYGFETIFTKQIEGLGNTGDIAFGISTSGGSRNVVDGIKHAKNKGLQTIGLLGCGGGEIKSLVDVAITVPSDDTPRIQESHQVIIHVLCSLIEKELA
ncbi:SIS domain-containing protein [Candidatus Margulisiibacteriota bacterium]